MDAGASPHDCREPHESTVRAGIADAAIRAGSGSAACCDGLVSGFRPLAGDESRVLESRQGLRLRETDEVWHGHGLGT